MPDSSPSAPARSPASWLTVAGVVARNELKLVLRQPTTLLVYAVFAAFLSYATLGGVQHVEALERAVAALLEEQESRHLRLIKQMHAIDAGTEKPDIYFRPDSPSWVGGSLGARYAFIPQDRLAPLALGQTDLLTDQYKVTSYDTTSFALDDPLYNPWRLLDGPFDPAFVIVYLLPLFLIGLTYNLISAQREDGTLALLLATTAPLTAWVAGKLAVRGGLLLLLSILVPAVLVLSCRGAAAASGLAVWATVVLAYGLFWLALSAAINAWPHASTSNALALCAIWAGVVFVLPVLLNASIVALHPAPSRIEMISQMRRVLADAHIRYGAIDTEDHHPELAKVEPGKVFIQGYQKASFKAQEEMKPHTDMLLRDAQAQLVKQQSAVDALQFLSPAILAHEAMTAIAGTGVSRYLVFFDQMTAFHDRRQAFFFPLVANETRLTDTLYEAMPRYEWREPPMAERWPAVGAALVGLLIPAALLWFVAATRVRRSTI